MAAKGRSRLWLTRRLRFSIRLRQTRYSVRTALEPRPADRPAARGGHRGHRPVWGMSWYFDTENWAAGVWNSWAEQRTDTWREAMVRGGRGGTPAATGADVRRRRRRATAAATSRSSSSATPARATPRSTSCATRSPGGRRPRSGSSSSRRTSCIPTGSMRDYEANFWLPFKGFDKPVYAIPGNHDWYDALEASRPPSSTPRPPRVRHARAGRGRQPADEHDRRPHRGADRRGRAAPTRVRRADRVSAGAVLPDPDRSLRALAVDTGVLGASIRRSSRGSRAALEQSRGKFTMVDPRPSALRRRAVPGRRRRGVRGHPRAAARARRRRS